ncbi:glycerol-3-phosphate dehydrogenase [Hwanghaeella grinnelliae]|uniref:Glycerol-3-phosphate dehydrogenase n=1 Tax=Hwanghaeella grinnelliae TaxID=2500179 RepID=A0A437QNH1_9PROT|nr:heterodisulfide reductase-related iron-sulfur binding cluster [Hwanghaeella grinnelliae]RVU36088.1 glycerol-3-phosphate dehydrogenase [Hwanghaeella grinnelliae]
MAEGSREGSLDAPTRHPIDWNNPEFYDEAKLDDELRRVFDICHGCRRCFNLCDSFPRLFDLIDDSESGELDTVSSKDFKPVVDACTLCDMCFMTKCPYVPPHEFNLDFPHLMLRYRAVEKKKGEIGGGMEAQLTETDRNGKLGSSLSGLANWATDRKNGLTRGVMQGVAGVHKDAALPKFAGKTFEKQAAENPPAVNASAPAHGRKAVIYATCYGNYNNPEIGTAALAILAHNGVEAEVVYPECCGMPQMEQGDLARVETKAKNIAKTLKPYIEKGYHVISLVPSCTLMLKFEWPLISPDDEDVKLLSGSTFDISEYIVDISKKEGLAEGLKPLDGDVSVHIACHARAQNMGQKAAELMKLVPDTKLHVVERCSGHGGSWGIKKEFFEVGMKVGKPVFRQALNKGQAKYVASECPLAGLHIAQGMEATGSDNPLPETVPHPVVLFARAYGLSF